MSSNICGGNLTYNLLDYFVSVGIIIILFLFFRILQFFFAVITVNERMRVFSLSKIREIVDLIFLMFIVYSIYSFIPTYLNVLFEGGSSYQDLLSYNPFLDKAINNVVVELSKIFDSISYLSYISSASTEAAISSGFVRATTSFSSQRLATLNSFLFDIYNMLYSLMFSLSIVKDLFCFLGFFSLFYLFPIGVALKATGFLSRVGGTLIALALSLGLFLPIINAALSNLFDGLFSNVSVVPEPSFLAKRVSTIYYSLNSGVVVYNIISPFISFSDIVYIPFLLKWVYDTFVFFISLYFFTISLIHGYSISSLDSSLFSIYHPSNLMVDLFSLYVPIAIYLFSLAFIAISFFRAISPLLGGEFFLYRISNYI